MIGARVIQPPVAVTVPAVVHEALADRARADGFADTADMGAWWCRNRSDGSLDFDGLLIEWAP